MSHFVLFLSNGFRRMNIFHALICCLCSRVIRVSNTARLKLIELLSIFVSSLGTSRRIFYECLLLSSSIQKTIYEFLRIYTVYSSVFLGLLQLDS